MRYLVIALMVVLLPLRSWAGDAMATQMATQMASSAIAIAIETAASSANYKREKGSFHHQKQTSETTKATQDCHGHAATQQAAQGEVDKNSHPAGEHCGICVVCQVCHTVALPSVLPGVTRAFMSPQLRQTSVAVFTSADAALGQKPPIA